MDTGSSAKEIRESINSGRSKGQLKATGKNLDLAGDQQ
jgi:hypothetical protein